MISLITKVGAAAMMAAAITPFLAVAAAHAQTVTVRISDLNLSRPAQVAVLNQRIEHVAKQICDSRAEPRNIGAYETCVAAVRAEANDKVAQAAHGLTVASR